jgi:hypothetical protein
MIENVRYSPILDAILKAAGPMPLDAGTVNAALSQQLIAFDFEAASAPATIQDRAAARACLAGLWLRINHLDRSHRISQTLDTAEGSFWHAIMHRRERDYANSKYWFRRVSQHLVFARIASNWDPFEFVDLVEECVTHHAGDENELRELQSREWDALFEFCWDQATGKANHN